MRQISTSQGFKITAGEPGPGGASHAYVVELPPAREQDVLDRATVRFQRGPVREAGRNGLTEEVLLTILIDRLEAFQNGPYRCVENHQALYHLRQAMGCLINRTERRAAAGIEGTSAVHETEG